MFVLFGANGAVEGVFTALELAAHLTSEHLRCRVEFWQGMRMKPVDITRLAGRTMERQLDYLTTFYKTEEKPLPL